MTTDLAATIAERVAAVQARIADACARALRDPAEVRLVAVSKQQPVDAIIAAFSAGVRHFGENRVEESEHKIPAVNAQVPDVVIWHMIGHIQSRKAKEIPGMFQVVHSVDSLKLAEKLSRLAVEQGSTLDMLLQMNVSGEASKSGFEASGWQQDHSLRDALVRQVRQIAALPGLHLRGLMTMAPITKEMEAARPVFADLARLRGMLIDAVGVLLPDLSMGMTDDYPVAVEEGATLVRVGRAIFGERPD